MQKSPFDLTHIFFGVAEKLRKGVGRMKFFLSFVT